jgi:hypothetical protein
MPPQKKKRPKTAKPKKANDDESDDGELYGTRIPEKKT